ncbi:Serine phosphatase RsbU, regulator of sigma subunit [Streptomyces sp. DvalAA-14]|uniref:SpoIIE family protein phosphatase n=1 Tax=unclassified Streptomyces TaxID=2593676 RepID=UPI00081B0D18|nr:MULTISPECIES: SpoIIE family protein phosphatase [unclassified Streptomyces]MYS20897.1 SpoIIE family protein phosphatase [Streptomyces sp. SID4948]SCD79521.1 Serine phosphatase RsbU, regulator of sigma subunit [Streptomyces sp. DvalAA-14]
MERPSASGSPSSDDSGRTLEEILTAELPGYLAANLMGGFIWEFPSDRVYLREGALRVFEFEPDEFDGRADSLRERMVTRDAPGLVERALAGADEYGAYFRTRSRDGTLRWAHVQAAIKRGDDGNALRAVGIVRNADAELSHAAQQAILAADRQQQTDVVQATTAALARALSVEDLLELVTGGPFLAGLGASGVALSVVEQDRRRLLATTGLPPELLHDLGVARIDSPLPIAEAIRSQTAFFITREDVRENYPLLWPYIEPTDLTSTAILPLAAEARPTGALAILYQGRRDFSPEERNLLLALAGTFSQSLQRALKYDQEHSMAAALQQAMLPARIPRVPGLCLAVRYQPAARGHQAGGDWYDAMTLPGGGIALVVGDVQGHDVHAAAVMGQVRAALRAYAAEGHSPETIMARTSRFLAELDTDLIATCICAHLRPDSASVTFVRAGHPYPLIRGADRRTGPIEVAGGLPLGLPQLHDEPYPATRIGLGPEDTLLMCTDGLLESHGSDLDAGERQIRTLLDEGPSDLDELAEHIVATIEQRQGQEDDIALLLACLDRTD